MKYDWLFHKIDNNPFPMHTVDLQNPKILIRPNQAESTKGKNVVIGDERPEKKLTSKTPQGAKTLGGKTRRRRPTTSRPI